MNSEGAFLYFFPNLTSNKLSRDWLKASPLSDVLRDCWERNAGWAAMVPNDVPNGPGGLSGVLLMAQSNPDQSCRYEAQHQTWTDCGTHWVGIDSRFRPTPASLQRRRIVPGTDVELADANVWHVPLIRQPSEPSLVPWIVRLPTVQTSGSLTTGVPTIAERFRELWELSGRVFDWWAFGTPLAPDKAQAMVAAYAAAAAFLGVNYRVGVHELDALQVFEDGDVSDVLLASFDAPLCAQFIEALGAVVSENPTSASALQSSERGRADSSHTIAQPAGSCT